MDVSQFLSGSWVIDLATQSEAEVSVHKRPCLDLSLVPVLTQMNMAFADTTENLSSLKLNVGRYARTLRSSFLK